jgi:hypothetical protein
LQYLPVQKTHSTGENMKRLILEQSSEEFYTSHSGLALAGACINRYSDLGRYVGREAKGSDHIAEIDILRSYLGLLCLGKSDFRPLLPCGRTTISSMGIGRIPSVERCARLDESASSLCRRCSRTMLKRLKVPITGYRNDFAWMWMSSPGQLQYQEGRSKPHLQKLRWLCTHRRLGMEGWCMEVELRPGSQHSQKGFIDFINRVISGAKDLTRQPLLVRADAGNDALETLVVLEDAENTHYIVKWNPRKSDGATKGPVKTPRTGKRVCTVVVEERRKVKETTYTFKRIVRVTERTIDKKGQYLLNPDITLEGWWTDLAMAEEDVIELYRQHATSEQFHSEFKTDLDLTVAERQVRH